MQQTWFGSLDNYRKGSIEIIKGKPQPAMEGVIISTTPECVAITTAKNPYEPDSCKFMIAGSADDIDAKKADITQSFEERVGKALTPKDGATFDFIGTPSSYTPNPFMMVMDKGQIVKAKPAAAPTHKAPTTHKAAQ